MNDKLIVIVGFMGCGKTVVARELSRLLDRPCLDLDARIEDVEGRSPARIISEDGEEAFRQKETGALRELLRGDEPAVVALGGGAWTIAENRELIRSAESVVFWLDTPFEICWERIEQEHRSRPMAPSRTAGEHLYTERRPAYRMSDVQISVSHESPTKIAENIAALLQQQSHN